ncbi:transposase [Streptomyces badius]
MGRHRLPHQGHRARRPPVHRRRSHPPQPCSEGFKVIPRRWVVERTFGWLMHHRRLARDYETHPHRSEAMIKVAMVDLVSRRLARESTPNWRDT